MTLFELLSLCERAIEKYGDADVYLHDKDEAYDVTNRSDCRYDTLSLRHFRGESLPGDPIDEDDASSQELNPFFVLFFS